MEKPYGLTVRGLAKKNKKILMVKRHPKSKTKPNNWEFPGGKVESNESFDQALIREFKEETNLNIKINSFNEAVQEEFPHIKTVTIIMNVDILSGSVQISDEHVDWKWVATDNLNNLNDLKMSEWVKNIILKNQIN